jgi:hypothetical protein
MTLLLGIASAILVRAGVAAQTAVDLWIFDRLDRIGDHPTTILGNPRVIDSPIGKAVEFDGVDDALVVDVHPLAGAETFTWEAMFRPDGGQAEQRWFHLQESGSDNRMLFEIRVVDRQWYLDSYGHSGAAQQALMDRTRLHPLGAWYHVAAVLFQGSASPGAFHAAGVVAVRIPQSTRTFQVATKTRQHKKPAYPFRAFVLSWLSPCSSGETAAEQRAALTLL